MSVRPWQRSQKTPDTDCHKCGYDRAVYHPEANFYLCNTCWHTYYKPAAP